VGHDEHPLSLVRRADFSRAEYSPRRLVTKFFQVADDCGESKRYVALDVLKEASPGSHSGNSISDVGPKVPWVVGAESLSCGTEWLARVAAREYVHQSAKLSPRETLEIAPDRSRIKLPAFHSRKKDFDGCGFDLRISDREQALANDSSESEVDAAIS
jgi:hypothetical protein